MRSTSRLLTVASAQLAAYVDYLQQADKELPSLHEVFPKSNTVEDVVKFHSSLCEVMEKNALPLVGIKVLPPSCEAVMTLRGTRAVCVPVFSSMFQRPATSMRKDRLQFVEATICMEVAGLLDTCDNVDTAATSVLSFSPGIEVNGSRFPFYAPTVTAMACDLAGCVNIVKGTDVTMGVSERANITTHRFVLTHNQEPLQVGSGRQCMESPFSAVVAAAEYAKAMKAPRNRSLFVFCGGVSPRTPVQPGTYAFEWGSWGRATYSVLP